MDGGLAVILFERGRKSLFSQCGTSDNKMICLLQHVQTNRFCSGGAAAALQDCIVF